MPSDARKYALLLVAVLSVLFARPLGAQDRSLLRYGVEWGLSASVYNSFHYNYIDGIMGYRIDEEGSDTDCIGNAFAEVYCGTDLSRRLSLTLRAGFSGIARGRRVVPICLRLSWFPAGTCADGFFTLADGGLSFPDFFEAKPAPVFRLGGGYRLLLTDSSSLDIQLCARLCQDHPDIWDEQERHYVETHNVRRSDAAHYALCLSAALNF